MVRSPLTTLTEASIPLPLSWQKRPKANGKARPRLSLKGQQQTKYGRSLRISVIYRSGFHWWIHVTELRVSSDNLVWFGSANLAKYHRTGAKEKLIMIDPNERCLSYEILENNVGFKSYVATIKVLPINDGDGDDHHGCEIEWSFITDPIEGWPLEDFNTYINSSLQFMGQKMEQAVLSR